MKKNLAKKVICDLEQKQYSNKVLSCALLFKGRPQAELFALARKRRALYFPDQEVEVRSVLEISNVCRGECEFCSINAFSHIKRYLIGYKEVLRIATLVYLRGRRVLLIQSGENDSQKFVDHVSRCIYGIKNKYPDLKIILCLGNLKTSQYRQLKKAGAERYILKFETSNPVLYSKIKPNDSLKYRINCLNKLIDLGFEVGTGNIVGLPGQTVEDIVADLKFMSGFKLKMGSSSVFVPGEYSKYKNMPAGSVDMTLNCMALMRIMYSDLLIPTTSSLEKIRNNCQYLGLMAGANTVTIHDGNPENMKKLFPIYSVNRFIPNEKHIRLIVKRSHLSFGCDKYVRG